MLKGGGANRVGNPVSLGLRTLQNIQQQEMRLQDRLASWLVRPNRSIPPTYPAHANHTPLLGLSNKIQLLVDNHNHLIAFVDFSSISLWAFLAIFQKHPMKFAKKGCLFLAYAPWKHPFHKQEPHNIIPHYIIIFLDFFPKNLKQGDLSRPVVDTPKLYWTEVPKMILVSR